MAKPLIDPGSSPEAYIAWQRRTFMDVEALKDRKPRPARLPRGVVPATTDGTGQVAVSLLLPFTPTAVIVSAEDADGLGSVRLLPGSLSAQGFVVVVRDPSGARMAGHAVTFHWAALQ